MGGYGRGNVTAGAVGKGVFVVVEDDDDDDAGRGWNNENGVPTRGDEYVDRVRLLLLETEEGGVELTGR